MELYLKLIDVLFPVFFIIGIGYYIGKKDPKTILQEYTQSNNLPLPIYNTEKLSGPPHSPRFRVSCVVNNSREISTLCSTVQEGQQQVADIILKKLKIDE